MAKIYKVLWDNGNDCGTLAGSYTSKKAAAHAAKMWKSDMVAFDDNPQKAEEAYSWEIIETGDNVPENSEEYEAAVEQSYDYFNRYVAGDR